MRSLHGLQPPPRPVPPRGPFPWASFQGRAKFNSSATFQMLFPEYVRTELLLSAGGSYTVVSPRNAAPAGSCTSSPRTHACKVWASINILFF